MQLSILKQLTPDLTAKQNQKISQNISKQERRKGNCSARKVCFIDGIGWLDVRWEWCSPYRNVHFMGLLFLPWGGLARCKMIMVLSIRECPFYGFALYILAFWICMEFMNFTDCHKTLYFAFYFMHGSYSMFCCSRAPHNNVSVSDWPHIQQWSLKIIIL